MASTFSTRLRLEKQADGENPNSWGDILNQNVIDLVDQAIAAYTTVAVSSVDTTLTSNEGSVDEARSPFIEVAGSVTDSLNIVIPAVSKGYVFKNVTTMVSTGTNITVKTAGGTGHTLTDNSSIFLLCDGTSVFPAVTDPSSFNLGTAASVNVGTSVNEVPTVSAANTLYARLSASNTFTGQLASTPVTLTDAASIALDLSTGNHFTVTLGGNRTLQNPTNTVIGQVGHIYIKQDGTGSRTLSFGDVYSFVSGTAPTLSTAASAVDLLVFSQRDTSVVDCVVAKNLSVPV